MTLTRRVTACIRLYPPIATACEDYSFLRNSVSRYSNADLGVRIGAWGDQEIRQDCNWNILDHHLHVCMDNWTSRTWQQTPWRDVWEGQKAIKVKRCKAPLNTHMLEKGLMSGIKKTNE